jgi:hypothetical protein
MLSFVFGIMMSMSLLFVTFLAISSILFPATMVPIYGQQLQTESEGDLEVVLNGEVFTTGQTITISGSVDDPGDQPLLNIEVVDPEGGVVERASPEITADVSISYDLHASLFIVLDACTRNSPLNLVFYFLSSIVFLPDTISSA